MTASIPKFTILLILLIFFFQANCQRPSNPDFCPNNCTSKKNGRCSISLKRCECRAGVFGIDCSQKVSSLSDKDLQKLSISPLSMKYFSLNIVDSLKSLTLKLKPLSSQNALEYYILLADPEENVLPNEIEHKAIKLVSHNSSSQAVTIDGKKLKEFEGCLIFIGVRNLGNHKETVKLKIKKTLAAVAPEITESTNIVTFVFWAIAFVGGCVTVARFSGWQFAEDEFGNLRFIQISAIKVQVSPPTKDLDSMFPVKKYEDFQVPFEQTSCSICLLNYESQDPCRSLSCEHIFHSQCIDDWLVKNDLCPNCKSKIQFEANSSSSPLQNSS